MNYKTIIFFKDGHELQVEFLHTVDMRDLIKDQLEFVHAANIIMRYGLFVVEADITSFSSENLKSGETSVYHPLTVDNFTITEYTGSCKVVLEGSLAAYKVVNNKIWDMISAFYAKNKDHNLSKFMDCLISYIKEDQPEILYD